MSFDRTSHTCVCQSTGSDEADGVCQMNDDEDQLDCELDFYGATWEEEFDWVKDN